MDSEIKQNVGVDELAKMLASDLHIGDNFRYSVAISSDRVVVGDPHEDTGGGDAGAVYIFDLDGNQLAKILASDAEDGDYFGWDVAISSDRMVVGAYGEDTNGIEAGAAYLFDLDGNQLAKILANDGRTGNYFGVSVAISDNRVVVGAPYEDTNGDDAGAVYVFDIDGNQLAKILASDAQEYDRFGYSVSLSNNRIEVSTYNECTGDSDTEPVYIFDIDGNQIAKNKPVS